ncbi:MAG: 50S ribosomal protein L13 [Patescibacteria group bacterium]|jgi:large subunit ribosomal protein L13
MAENNKTIEIDAAGQVLGRLATEVASLLRGKNLVDFAPNKLSGVKVVIKNAEKIRLTGNKIEDKKYQRHTGYIGNLKTKTLKVMIEKPEFVINHAVSGMLPKNRLQKEWMKNLTILKGE